MTSSLMLRSRSTSTTASDGPAMLSSVKCALRFFLMRNASDFSPQGSTLVTAPPSEAIFDLICSVSVSTCCEVTSWRARKMCS